MLYFRTGKPGHGKTLNTIREIDDKAHRERRLVYFHNVTGLKPERLQASWFPFDDPHDWFNLPPNSIIVIDEAQGFFPVRDPRQKVPEYVSRFELIRKAGHEVHLVTQDPRYIDVHLRRLANGHIHYWRVFKSTQVLRFESEAVIEAVEKKASFKDVDKRAIKLDARFFGVYDSINANAVHHFKFKPPIKMVLAVALIVGVSIFVFRVYSTYSQRSATLASPDTAAAPTASPASGPVAQAVSAVTHAITGTPTGPAATGSAVASRVEYFSTRVPRIQNVPASAPVYDKLTEPVAYPKLLCIATEDPELVKRRPAKSVAKNGSACQCYTQQGNRLNVSPGFCLAIVRDGYFDPAVSDRGTSKASAQPAVAQQTDPVMKTAARDGLTLSVVKDSEFTSRPWH